MLLTALTPRKHPTAPAAVKWGILTWPRVGEFEVTAGVAVIGWWAAHALNARREVLNRRREARLKGLETAYTRLALIAHREWTDELKMEFEKFVAEIQLYGTPSQVNLMSKLVISFVGMEKAISLDPLLEDLRDVLRTELKMESIAGPVWWYRFEMPSSSVNDTSPNSPSDGLTSEARNPADP